MRVAYGWTAVRFVATALLVAGWQSGCSTPNAPEEVGTIRVTITTVPADVACVSLSAAGATRTVVQNFDVTAGASSVLAMGGIPTGSVVFTGRAFAAACASVAAGALPNWTSDPVTVQVTSGATADVTIVMRRSGNANVSVDFADDTPPSVATATTVTSSANPAVTGQSVTITMTVTAVSGTQIPTGSVRLREGTMQGPLVPLGPTGSASITIGQIAFREHPFTAEYMPTGPFQPSSGGLVQIVNPASTGTTLTGPTPSVEVGGVTFVQRGTAITFLASVRGLPPGSGGPDGFVEFTSTQGLMNTATITAGETSIITSFDTTGTVGLTARYTGTFAYLASSATTQFEVVDQLPGPSQCQPPSGVVSWWHADFNFLDAVSNNHGSPVGQVTFAPGIRGTGFVLNDTTTPSFVDVPDAPNLRVTTGLTIDAWVSGSGTTLSGRIVDKISAFQEDGYLLDFINDRLRMQVGGSAVVSEVLSIAGLTHVAGVYDGQRVELYVNGVSVAATATGMTSVPINNRTLRIGADSGGGSLFTGIIDEPRIFNRGLTTGEVQTLFQQGTTCP